MTSIYDYFSRPAQPIYVLDTAPPVTDNALWFDTTAKIWYVGENGAWVPMASGAAPVVPPSTAVGKSPPANPVPGTIWIDTSRPSQPRLKFYSLGGVWTTPAADVQLPPATRQGQAMIAGLAPSFNWAAGEVDGGRY
jgi:hypothetical protein